VNKKNKHISVQTKAADPKLTFRVPLKLKAELMRRAHRSGRTLNAEIMIRLIKSLELHALITEVPYKMN
jgi:hypothetical protein